jgi:hypothetical protein
MKSRSYKQLLWLTFWLWLGFVVGMSVLVSNEMAAHPAAQGFADFMAQFIPMLNNIRKIPGATEWVRFYYAVFWAVSPFFIVLAWKASDLYMEVKFKPPISKMKWSVGCIGMVGLAATMWYWPVADGLGWRDQSMVRNIVSIGYHSLMMVFIWLLIGGQLRGTFYFIWRGTPYWPCGNSVAEALRNQDES